MTDEDRKRIVSEARATVERVRGVERERGEFALPPLPDPIARWKADGERRAADRAAAKAEIAAASRPAVDWNEVDRRIQTAIERECERVAEAIVQGLGEFLIEEKRVEREDFRQLKAMADRLADKFAELRAMITLGDRERVIDMPSPLARRTN
jgi:hypothetical protein